MESQPVTEMNPAPSESSAQSRMSRGGLLDSGQRQGHPCFFLMQACFYFLFYFFIIIFPFNLQKAFNALCHSTHLYGRRLVLEWADTEESTVEALRRKTADHFHGNVAASFWPGRRSLAGTGPSGTRLRSAPALSPPRWGCQMDAGARRCQRRGSRPAEAAQPTEEAVLEEICCGRGAGGGRGPHGGKQEGSGQDALSDSSPCAREAVNSPRAGGAEAAERFLLCLPCALGCSRGGDRLRAPLVAP